MVEAGARNGAEIGIGEFLRTRARDVTDSRIALDIAVGAVAVIIAAATRPALWLLLASSGLCLASFGMWAGLERTRFRAVHSRRLEISLSAASGLFAMLGIGAAVATGFFLWAALMGTWIS
jgi:hypothetical protein